MKFKLFDFSPPKNADYYQLSFYEGFSHPLKEALFSTLLNEKFYSIRSLNKSVVKQVWPSGRYLLACLLVTKLGYEGQIVAQLNYYDLIGQENDLKAMPFEIQLMDDDINYLTELLYNQSA